MNPVSRLENKNTKLLSVTKLRLELLKAFLISCSVYIFMRARIGTKIKQKDYWSCTIKFLIFVRPFNCESIIFTHIKFQYWKFTQIVKINLFKVSAIKQNIKKIKITLNKVGLKIFLK